MRFQEPEIVEWLIPIVHQTSPTLNKWTKNSDNLGRDMALFGTPSWA